MPADPAQIIARYTRLEARAVTYREHCQEIAEYLVPDKSIITRLGGIEGERRMDRIFDSTGPEALGLLCATMMSALTPSTMRWFGIKSRDESLNEQWEAQNWLQHCEERIRLAIGQSNFYSEKFSADQDKIAFGTSAMLIEERAKPPRGVPFGGLLFRTIPIGEWCIEEGPDGMVDTLCRCFQMSARAIVMQWQDKASEHARTLADKRPDERLTLIHAVYPRTLAYPRRDTQGLPFASCYIEKQTAHLLEESGFHEFPYTVPRWEKLTGEVYGRGQGMRALPDLKTLNKADELTLEAWALAIRPPRWAMEDGVVGDIDLTPDGLTMVTQPNAMGYQEQGSVRFEVNEGLTKERQDRIRRIFFWHQLQLQEGRVMTATEVERRWDTMRRILGPTLERQEYEDLTPIIARVFGLMQRAGALPPIPEVLIGQDLDIVYEGPLSRSQKVGRVAGMEQITAHVTALAAVDPSKAIECLDNLDMDDSFRDLCEIAGLPPSYMKSREEVAEIRAARTQRQQKEQQMAGFEQAANIAKGAAPMLQALQGGMPQGQPAQAA
jgi:hypothetical protein